MFKRIALVGFSLLLAASASAENLPGVVQGDKTGQQSSREILTDAAIATLIVAASIAAYKAMGRPCACPSDTMSNGRKCGGNSAYLRPGGFKPLCFPSDVTAAMIAAYRATKAIPGLK